MWGSQVGGVGHYARYMDNRHSGDGNEALKKFLSLGDDDGVWQGDGSDPNYQKKADQVQEELKQADQKPSPSRRSYDSPSKGVLWGWQVTGYLWTKAIAAGVCIIPMAGIALGREVSAIAQWFAIVMALIFLGVTGLLLTMDLDQPKRFLYVLLRPQWKSWLVRGAYIITAYSGVLLLWCLARLINTGFANALAWPLVILAILTAIYTAFLFSQAKGRDFWQNPVLPIHMLAHAVMAGAAVFCMYAPFASLDWEMWVRGALVGSIALRVACDLFEMWTKHPTRDAQKVAHSIFRFDGQYAKLYWVGVFLVGAILPLVIGWSLTKWLLPVAGILTLVGIYLAEHIWVRAPQKVPLA